MDAVEPETLKEAMTRPNRHFWKMSAISEVKNLLSRNTLIPINRSKVKPKGMNLLPVKWVYKSK